MTPMTDFHTHILPGVDDGSPSVEDSLAMLRKETEQDVWRVIASSHFYASVESPEAFLQRRKEAEAVLRQAMQGQMDLPDLRVGAEVHYFDGMSECEALSELTVEGTRLILVEMPVAEWSSRHFDELVGIRQKQGLIPVVAHVERYLGPFFRSKAVDNLMNLPVFVQANAEFFTFKRSRRKALRWLKEGRIHFMGSDCHNLTDRPPNVGEAVSIIESALGDRALDRLRSFEEALMSGVLDPGMSCI